MTCETHVMQYDDGAGNQLMPASCVTSCQSRHRRRVLQLAQRKTTRGHARVISCSLNVNLSAIISSSVWMCEKRVKLS